MSQNVAEMWLESNWQTTKNDSCWLGLTSHCLIRLPWENSILISRRVAFEYKKFMYQISTVPVLIKGRTIRKLMGGGDGRSTNKIFAQGKIEWKKFITPINRKKYLCYGLKKIKGIWWRKKFLRLKNSPPPPHNFSNGPSLTLVTWSILNHSLFCDGIQKAVLFCNLFRRWNFSGK